MKIICIDNFNREEIADQLIQTNINKTIIHNMVKIINDNCATSYGPDWYKAVSDNYVLSKGMEDLI